MTKQPYIKLVTHDDDLCLCPAGDARALALKYANAEGKTVYARDPITDQLKFKVAPEGK